MEHTNFLSKGINLTILKIGDSETCRVSINPIHAPMYSLLLIL